MFTQRLRYGWQTEFQPALLELKPENLMGRITEAEAAIFDRLQKISSSQQYLRERIALDDALRSLRLLKKETPGVAGPDDEINGLKTSTKG